MQSYSALSLRGVWITIAASLGAMTYIGVCMLLPVCASASHTRPMSSLHSHPVRSHSVFFIICWLQQQLLALLCSVTFRGMVRCIGRKIELNEDTGTLVSLAVWL